LYRLFNIKLIILGIFVAGIIGLSSCSQVFYWRTDSESVRAEKENAEQRLFESITILIEIDPASDPEKYYESKTAFEQALEQYLVVMGKQDRSLIHLDYKGTNIIIPIRRLDRYDDTVDLVHSDTVSIFWQSIGPTFHDETVDITVVPDDNGDHKIAILFADSLVFFTLRDNENYGMVHSLPFRKVQPIRSRTPSGMIDFDPTGDGNRIYVISNHTESSHILNLSESTKELIEGSYPIEVRPVAGRPYFLYNDLMEIFGVRYLNATEQMVVLDNRGKLNLYSYGDESIIWQSERRWGNRLFRVGTDRVAVTHPSGNSFVLFNIDTDSIDVVGVSPRFHGQVSAVARIELSEREGYLVSITSGAAQNTRYSQLHFIPSDVVRWKRADSLSQPEFPDYNAEFYIVDNLGDIFESAYLERGLNHSVWYNVYETPLRYDRTDELHYNLAFSVTPDNSGLQWTVTFKENIRFSDGTTLTADDVKDSWLGNFTQCLNNNCGYRWLFESIEDILVTDSLTVKVYLNQALINFKEHLTSPCFSIAKIIDSQDWPIGTGPFVIDRVDRRQSPRRVRCERNPYYHGGLAPVERITFLLQRTDIIDYLTGRDNTGALIREPREIDFFQAINTVSGIESEIKKTYFLVLNPRSTRLRSVEARARIVGSFQREAVLTTVTGARSEIASSFFRPSNIPIRESITGSVAPITGSIAIYYLAQDPVSEQIAQRLSVRLLQVGISAQRPEGLSKERFMQVRANGRYDILVDSVSPTFAVSSYNMYNLLHRGYMFDDFLTDKSGTLLLSDDVYKVEEIEEYIAGQFYMYPLIQTSFHLTLPKYIRNVEYNGTLCIDFSGAWIPN
jgi:MarR-like DNA-binding transcriptional regulator SgrR of sgrS sRNA